MNQTLAIRSRPEMYLGPDMTAQRLATVVSNAAVAVLTDATPTKSVVYIESERGRVRIWHEAKGTFLTRAGIQVGDLESVMFCPGSQPGLPGAPWPTWIGLPLVSAFSQEVMAHAAAEHRLLLVSCRDGVPVQAEEVENVREQAGFAVHFRPEPDFFGDLDLLPEAIEEVIDNLKGLASVRFISRVVG